MGQFISQVQQPLGSARNSLTAAKKRKRSSSPSDSDELNEVLDASMRSPRKKKLTTAQYIYQALFKEEKSSDITVCARGKLWRLHKVYLCQSPYFASMFSGSWKETNKDLIDIDVVDPRITKESLFTVFGSLYLDEITLEPRDIISTLATATLFQLDGLIERCAEVMNESINAETAIEYYEAACQYGVKSVKRAAFDWLLANLLSFYTKHWRWLRQINVDLMHMLITHADLFVMQTEFSVYILLRFWMFYNLNPEFERVEKDDHIRNPIHYFSQREGEVAFLETYQGRKFRKPFLALRMNHLLSHHRDVEVLLKDNILPKSWFFAPLLQQWSSMLSIDESLDRGPTEDCPESVFYDGCLRCGRTLQEEGFQKWRWTGFNFGLDLVLITETSPEGQQMLSIRRHHRTEHEKLLSMQVKRTFLIRVTVASLNELRQVKHKQCTGIRALSLEKNQEVQLLTMDKELEYPLLISVNLLITSPSQGSIEKKLRDFQQIVDSGDVNVSLSQSFQQLDDAGCGSPSTSRTTTVDAAATLDSV